MALDLLFPHFDELVRTPEDVQRLNEAILQLAVQGKLVPQDPRDVPASELLKRVEATRRQLAKAGRVDKARDTSEIELHEYPFQLPTGWSVTRLAALVSKLGAGSTPLGGKSVYEDEGVKFIRSQNVWNDGLRLDDVAFIPESIHQRMSGTTVMPKDVLLNITGASIGRSSIVPDNFDVGNVSQHVAIVRLLEPDLRQFIHLYVISSYFQRMIMAVEVGISREGLSMSRLQHFVLPVPPLTEQHRIVAKVDELFAQTRALEARLRQAQADVVTANRAALHRLHTAQDDDQFQAAWGTIRDHFDVLYDDPRNVAELRQTILDLAVRGKLVAQDPDDEPAEGLLRRIEAERERLVKERLISAEDVGELQLDSTPHVPIAVLGEVRSGIQKSSTRDPKDNPRRYITVAHVQRNRIDLGDPRYFEVSDEELEKWRLVSGDVLVIEGNGSAEHIGRAALFLGEIEDCVHQNHVIRIRPNRDFILPEYLNLYLNSPPGREKILERSRTTSGLYNLSVGRTRTIEVPLPALLRQQRTVAKVDQLMRLCDALEAGLAQAQAQRHKLVAAMLA